MLLRFVCLCSVFCVLYFEFLSFCALLFVVVWGSVGPLPLVNADMARACDPLFVTFGGQIARVRAYVRYGILTPPATLQMLDPKLKVGYCASANGAANPPVSLHDGVRRVP
jgi:hypothetical protein